MNDNSDRPIIIKKNKKHGGHHGGAWKVAYADFVTAMMALFIVLWVLSQDDSIKQSIAKYFKNPVGFSEGGNILKGGGNEIINLSSPGDENKKKREREELKKMGEKILSELSKNPDFHNLLDQIKIEIVEEGLRIEIIDASDDIFFEIGTSRLKEQAKKLLEKIGLHLSKLNNKIVIEGHTDARPYNGTSSEYTNFELSSDRANSARRAVNLSGVNETRIDEVRGYADKRLRDDEDPYSFLNRRISIIVKFTD